MSTPRISPAGVWAGVVFFLFILSSGCGDGGTGIDEQTGATLQGQIVVMGLGGAVEPGSQPGVPAAGSLLTLLAPTSDVGVTIGGLSTTTDQNGSFVVHNIPLGNQTVVFSGSGITGSYSLNDVVQGASFLLNGIQVGNGVVKTQHTGTWIGTAGSQSGGHGQIAFTLTIAANGNSLSGTGKIEVQDTTQWSMSGTETGTKVDGTMTLVSSNSSCATGATFTGVFSADTLNGTFVEVNPPMGCGTPESGTFRVVKQ